MEPRITDIFTFDPSYIYRFFLTDGIVIEGSLIDAKDNGVILNKGEHIPTDKIVYFIPVGKLQKDETEY